MNTVWESIIAIIFFVGLISFLVSVINFFHGKIAEANYMIILSFFLFFICKWFVNYSILPLQEEL